jgi:hypothetical protein
VVALQLGDATKSDVGAGREWALEPIVTSAAVAEDAADDNMLLI